MTEIADPITVSVSRGVLSEIVPLSAECAQRIHELLERNTDGHLTSIEKSGLEALVRVVEFGQIVAIAML